MGPFDSLWDKFSRYMMRTKAKNATSPHEPTLSPYGRRKYYQYQAEERIRTHQTLNNLYMLVAHKRLRPAYQRHLVAVHSHEFLVYADLILNGPTVNDNAATYRNFLRELYTLYIDPGALQRGNFTSELEQALTNAGILSPQLLSLAEYKALYQRVDDEITRDSAETILSFTGTPEYERLIEQLRCDTRS